MIFEKRFLELERVLLKHGLLRKGQSLDRGPFRRKSTVVFALSRAEHALLVEAYNNGTVVLTFGSKPSEPNIPWTIVSIASIQGENWQIWVDDGFPDRCTQEQLQLWNDMPARLDVSKGTFTKRNALIALDLFCKRFPQEIVEAKPKTAKKGKGRKK